MFCLLFIIFSSDTFTISDTIGVVVAVIGIVVSVIIALFKKIFQFKAKLFSPFGKEDDILNKQENFIPNHFTIKDINGSEISDSRKEKLYPNNSLDFLIKKKLLSEDGIIIYFLQAGTGIGKTTYLVNIFLRYKQLNNPWSKNPSILLMNYASLKDMTLSEYTPDKTILLIDAMDELKVEKKMVIPMSIGKNLRKFLMKYLRK